MSDVRNTEIDVGTAYGMKPATYRRELVEVDAGTPMGELMRRYWQPFALSEDLKSDRPRRVRLLGEDLILFRDKEGRAGLLHEHCTHRGSSLYFGRVDDDGIRCCYHGWKFDVQGRCLDQPAEVDGGKHRDKARQPWYPVEERYGLIYAYMGPPEKKPALPRWEHFENLADDEFVEVRWRPGYGPLNNEPYNPMKFNFLQAYENTTDAPHLPWLHYHHSGDQFTGADLMHVDGGEQQQLPPYAHIKDLSGQIVCERTELGIKQGVPMPVPGQGYLLACNETIVPNIAVIATIIDLLYFVPVDNTSFFMLLLCRTKKGESRANFDLSHGGKTWWECSEEDLQRMPSDYEAQSSIGALPAHNREHLVQGDVPLVLLRRRLAEAVKDVQEGRDPPGVQFGSDVPPLRIAAHGLIPYNPGT